MGLLLSLYIMAGGLSLIAGKGLTDAFYKFDHNRHDQQRKFNNLSKVYAGKGMVRLPKILDELAYDDILEFLASALDFADEVYNHPELIDKEFEDLFARELAVKAKDPVQVAWIQSQLAAIGSGAGAAPSANSGTAANAALYAKPVTN